jgi:hypothetical protein
MTTESAIRIILSLANRANFHLYSTHEEYALQNKALALISEKLESGQAWLIADCCEFHKTGGSPKLSCGGDTAKSPLCECSDPGCPECGGECSHHSTETLYRIDMEDESGTQFCDQCSADAMDSGVFTTEKGDSNWTVID